MDHGYPIVNSQSGHLVVKDQKFTQINSRKWKFFLLEIILMQSLSKTKQSRQK